VGDPTGPSALETFHAWRGEGYLKNWPISLEELFVILSTPYVEFTHYLRIENVEGYVLIAVYLFIYLFVCVFLA